MTEQTPPDRRDGPASGGSWGDHGSDATQVVRPPPGGYDQQTAGAPSYPRPVRDEPADPFSAPMPATGNPPVGAPISGSETSAGEPGHWSPAYPAQPAYGLQAAVTSVYPPSTPGYAPAGHPAEYAPPIAVPPLAAPVVVATPSSRVGPGFLSAVIGLVLSAGGVYLAAKFGVAAATDIEGGKVGFKNTVLTVVGGVLLFAAVGLDGWSPWATILPGIALTGIGGWTLFSVAGQTRVAGWVKSVVPEFSAWTVVGFSLILGLVMLAASIAATMARASGKKDGRIIGARQL